MELMSSKIVLATIFGAFLANGCAEKIDSSMTLNDFGQMTLRVIEEDGIAEYLPTVALIAHKEVRTLQGIPEGVDHLEALQTHVESSDWLSSEFFFAAKASSDRLVLGHFIPGESTQFIEIVEKGGRYQTVELLVCDQWKLD